MKGLEEIEIGNLETFSSDFGLIENSVTNKDLDGKQKNDNKDSQNEEEENEDVIVITDGKDSKENEDGSLENNSSNEDPSRNGEPSSPIYSFASALHEKGIITNLDIEKLKTAEDPHEALLDFLDGEVNSRVEEYKNSLDPQKKEEIEAKEKGIDIKEYNGLKSDIDFLNSLKDEQFENKDLSRKLIAFDLADRGFTQEEIDEELDNYEDLGKLEDKAKKASQRLLQSRKSKFDGLEQKASEYKQKEAENKQKELEKIVNSVKETKELIPGLQLTDKAKEKLIDSLTKPKKVNGKLVTSVEEKMMKDPVKFDIMLHYMNMLGFFDGNFDSLINTSKTTAVKKFKESLNSNTSFGTGSTVRNKETDSEWLESLKQFSKNL